MATRAGNWCRWFRAPIPRTWSPTSSVLSARAEPMADDVAGPAAGEAPASRVRARLSELGRELPTVAAPVAAYVPAVRTGRYVQTSGQLPFVDGALPATGKVGAEVSLEQAAELAVLSCLNALAAIEAVAGSLDRAVPGGKGAGREAGRAAVGAGGGG